MISRSFERPDRTVSRASDARNRYKIRYTRTQHRPTSRQVNDHGRVSGTHTLAAYDRIVGFDLTEVAVDGSAHKAPCGGPGTGRNPTDRGKSGWKWSLLCDRSGIPVGWSADGANRHDQVLFAPTLDAAADRGLLADVETLHLDRGYDSATVRACAADRGI